jgi:hypothetical protein
MSKKPVARKPDFLSRFEHDPAQRPSGPSWPGTIAQARHGLPPRHSGRPDTIFIGRLAPHDLTFPQPRSNLILSLCLS